jgi:hypothetical protein
MPGYELMHRSRQPAIMAALLLAVAFSSAAEAAVPLSQEPTDLRAGQKVRVDDGTCPAGQVKEVMGTAMRQSNGTVIIKRIRNCVRR